MDEARALAHLSSVLARNSLRSISESRVQSPAASSPHKGEITASVSPSLSPNQSPPRPGTGTSFNQAPRSPGSVADRSHRSVAPGSVAGGKSVGSVHGDIGFGDRNQVRGELRIEESETFHS